ncbi:hypothetical protein BDP55DRAFT_628713 [Colletotrichum godetiae]|uniref:Uncharacterized protein n=1 Tax=Colletotrichum godetiae TaxID=1209918 RepID=A0AAJ0AV27_9PEZI|nr:uncharacterized protein BDP55DRAFT_628713 [Colletotrichum godetiae]KAK1689390.1 hypothetical protein BDP55DRAFT_628713 [Colletotrichum godetiae]
MDLIRYRASTSGLPGLPPEPRVPRVPRVPLAALAIGATKYTIPCESANFSASVPCIGHSAKLGCLVKIAAPAWASPERPGVDRWKRYHVQTASRIARVQLYPRAKESSLGQIDCAFSSLTGSGCRTRWDLALEGTLTTPQWVCEKSAFEYVRYYAYQVFDEEPHASYRPRCSTAIKAVLDPCVNAYRDTSPVLPVPCRQSRLSPVGPRPLAPLARRLTAVDGYLGHEPHQPAPLRDLFCQRSWHERAEASSSLESPQLISRVKKQSSRLVKLIFMDYIMNTK